MLSRRVVVTRYGGPEVLTIVEEPLAEPERGKVRLRTLAAGVSYADLLMREGLHPETWMRRPPFTPGWDVVGVVEKIGEGVRAFTLGDVVAALPVTGGYAETLCLAERELVHVPPGVDPVKALSLILNYTTAFQMLHRVARVNRGETILVYSAGGGVGTALLQLGNLLSLTMYGVASRTKEDIVRDNGGIYLDSNHETLEKNFMELSGGGDSVFDGVCGHHLQDAYRMLRKGGRLVCYGLSSSIKEGKPISPWPFPNWSGWIKVFSRNITSRDKKVYLYSIQVRKRLQPDQFFGDLARLLELLSVGKLDPVVGQCFSLEDVAQAHRVLASNQAVGKIVLTMSG